jgi:hypothetical protein
MDFLKAELVGKNKWRVLAIPFGGPLPGEAVGMPDNKVGYDTDGEFFTPETDIKPDWFDRRPLVWHHNLDKNVDEAVIGTADDLEFSDEGWWVTTWLDRSNRYHAAINQLLQAGKIYGSSGSLPNFVKTDRKTGEIKVWPYIEQTYTPTPANLLSRVVAAKAVSHFEEAQIGLSPLNRGLLLDLDSQTADLPADLPSGGDAAAMQARRRGIAMADAVVARTKAL